MFLLFLPKVVYLICPEVPAIVWLIWHSITLTVITAMVAAGPQYHLDAWRNTYKLTFLADENIYVFYTTVAILLCMGPISYGTMHWQIFSVDWQETIHDPPPRGAIGAYMHHLYQQSEGTAGQLLQPSLNKRMGHRNGRRIKPSSVPKISKA